MTLDDCALKCLHDCSCVAYAPTNDDGTGCEIWGPRATIRIYTKGRTTIIFKTKESKWWKPVTLVIAGVMLFPHSAPSATSCGKMHVKSGYKSPEYAFHGLVSIKTDVFSFGVLLLEVVSGKKNNYSYHPEHPLNLIGYAWQLWNEGRRLELMDPTLDDEVLRCIHIGLLCVQDHAADRPTMSDDVSMLSNQTMALVPPNQPAFFLSLRVVEDRRQPHEIQNELSTDENPYINNVSISVMEAR